MVRAARRRREHEVAEGGEARVGPLEFRTLAEVIPSPMFAADADGRHLYTNSAYQRFSGLARRELQGFGFVRVLHPEDRVAVAQRWRGIRTTRAPFELDCRLRRADGTYRWHVVRGAPVKDATGSVLRWMGSCTDVEELRRAVARADDAIELLASLGRLTDALVFAKDGAGNMVYANAATLDVLGATESEVLNRPAAGSNALDVERIEVIDARVRDSGETVTAEEPWTSPGGRRRFYRSAKGPWRRADGTVGIVGISVDATRERELEEALANSNAQFRAVFDNLPILLWLTDAKGRVLVQNNLWFDYSGFPAGGEPVSFADMIDPVTFPDFASRWAACVEDGDVLDVEIGLLDRVAGRHVPHRVTAFPHHARQGSVSGWVGSAVPV